MVVLVDEGVVLVDEGVVVDVEEDVDVVTHVSQQSDLSTSKAHSNVLQTFLSPYRQSKMKRKNIQHDKENKNLP